MRTKSEPQLDDGMEKKMYRVRFYMAKFVREGIRFNGASRHPSE
jgi:hypothetical protein